MMAFQELLMASGKVTRDFRIPITDDNWREKERQGGGECACIVCKGTY